MRPDKADSSPYLSRILLFLALNKWVLTTLAAGTLFAIPAHSDDSAMEDRQTSFRVSRAEVAPQIDGRLNDSAWQHAGLELSQWISYNPSYGLTIPQETQVLVTYDRDNLYLAFRCLDPEPSKIKTSISRRDNTWMDDWVGLSLDALADGQSTYDMFVNPNGIQSDLLDTSTAGEQLAPDWIWESSGTVTEEGYEVEVRLPWKSIRFRGGQEVRMGILFWRRVSRLGVSVSWPEIPPDGRWVFGRHATLVFENLEAPRLLEFLPSFTFSARQSRQSSGLWRDPESVPDMGITAKYGLTSTVTLDATVNPDFSQVESDAFQVDVNERFPIFFPEKRPFFMEGMGTFDLAGTGGNSNMRTALHSRRIVNPSMGLKLTGRMGRVNFGLLSAGDELVSGTSFGFFENQKLFNVARAFYSLGSATHIGGIFTHTGLAGENNWTAGFDFSLRFRENHRLQGAVLQSGTETSEFRGSPGGPASEISYGFSSKRLNIFGLFEHFDDGFRMDTAFYNRVGFTSGLLFTALNFYPSENGTAFLKGVTPYLWTNGGRDRLAGGDEFKAVLGLRLSFTRQGFLSVEQQRGQEPWASRVFSRNGIQILGGAQLTRWLNVFGRTRFSDSVFYDPVNPLQGKTGSHFLSLAVQRGPKVRQDLSLQRTTFDRASDGSPVFKVNILYTRTTYQFSSRFFLRAIFQIDTFRRRGLTDFLASYELVPGTVVYGGYGSLLERGRWTGLEGTTAEEYRTTQRSFFFKASYLLRF